MALSELDSISDAQFEAFCRAVEQSKEKRMKVCTRVKSVWLVHLVTCRTHKVLRRISWQCFLKRAEDKRLE